MARWGSLAVYTTSNERLEFFKKAVVTTGLLRMHRDDLRTTRIVGGGDAFEESSSPAVA